MLKDPRKEKTLLKKKAATFQENESHLFGKKFQSHIIEIKRSMKNILWKFLWSNQKTLPFEKDFDLSKTDCKFEGNTVTRKNPAI